MNKGEAGSIGLCSHLTEFILCNVFCVILAAVFYLLVQLCLYVLCGLSLKVSKAVRRFV